MTEKIRNFLGYLRFLGLKFFAGRRIFSSGRNYFRKGYLKIQDKACINLGENNMLEGGYDLEVRVQLFIGSRNYFNKNVKIVCFDKIEIGDDCLFADSVHIYDHDHRYDDITKPISAQGYVTAPVKIGNNVWLGAKVTVLKGVTIGDGVVVGANSVVTSDLPAFSVCGGVPAKVIKMRK